MQNPAPINPPITVGVVGLGRAGWNLHLKPLLALSGFKIAAAADPLADRLQEAKELTGCDIFSSIDDLLAGSEAQLIVVATPSVTHYEDVSKVLRASRHCIAEKPLALKTAEADELVSIARENRLGLFVHHTFLHGPEYYHLKGIIDSGVLGDLFSLRVCWGRYARRWDWQSLKKNGGGELNNTCPHALTVVLPLLGSPVARVFADLRNIKDAGDAEDHVHMVLQTQSGISADVVVSSAMALSGPRWLVCGSRGTLSLDGEVSRLRYYDGSKVERMDILDAAAPERQYSKETLPWEEKEISVEPAPVAPFHKNVFDVLTGQAEQIVTPESAAEVVRVLNLARAASGETAAF